MNQWPVDDIENAPADENLVSPRGAARREVMLQALGARLRQNVRRRTLVRRVSGSAAALMVFAGAWFWFSRNPGPTMTAPAPQVAAVPEKASPPRDGGPSPDVAHPAPVKEREPRLAQIQVVRNDPALAAQWKVPPGTPAIARISDAELRTALRAAGVDDGLIRLEGKLQLARDVVASESGQPQDGPQGRGASAGETVPST